MISYIKNRVHEDIEQRSQDGAYIYSAAWFAIGLGTGFAEQSPVYFWSILAGFVGLGLFRLSIYKFTKHVDKSKSRLWSAVLYFNTIMPALSASILFSLSMLVPAFAGMYFYLILMCFAMLSGGVVNFSPYPRLSFYYLAAIVLPAFFGAVLFNNEHFLEASMVLIYGVFMYGLSRRLSREYEQLVSQQEQLERLNNEDSLTGLANRRSFDTSFASDWETHVRLASPMHLIIFDIDHFKKINDTYGHAAGDFVIQQVASSIKSVFQRTSDSVARIGGEEFAVLLPIAQYEAVCEMAESCRAKISSSPLNWEGQTIDVTISIGLVACTPTMDIKPLLVFKMADQCLYAAKKSGRNRVACMAFDGSDQANVTFMNDAAA